MVVCLSPVLFISLFQKRIFEAKQRQKRANSGFIVRSNNHESTDPTLPLVVSGRDFTGRTIHGYDGPLAVLSGGDPDRISPEVTPTAPHPVRTQRLHR